MKRLSQRGSRSSVICKKFKNVTIKGYVVPQGKLPPNPYHPDSDVPKTKRRDRLLDELAKALAEIVPASEEGSDELSKEEST